ncbi:MAG: DUF4397 domain-containing protein [Gemmatimonadaceae bacterium]|nr:DUF4397 domain-containing protein [Gemmatimonadaceae bacterium]
MRRPLRWFAVAGVAIISLAACGSDSPLRIQPGPSQLRVINAFPSPVDLVVDGSPVALGIAAGTVAQVAVSDGAHAVALRSGTTTTAAQSVTAAFAALPTIAGIRSASGALTTTALDDTNSVVPAGATKLRVLHLAANAGELQVYRTQPDFATPVRWQFPFTYQTSITSLSAPFYQSTVGNWEVRVWQTPTDATGWGTSVVRVTVTLGSGGKRTVVILDAPGGGVRLEVL